MKRPTSVKYFLGLILIIPLMVYSHPHSFITLNTEFYIEDNQLTKLHFTWQMDELTSSYLKLEYEQDPKVVFDDLMINIFENHFFSEFWLKSIEKNKAIILMPQEKDATLDFDDNKAVVNFWVKLKNPISIIGNQFELITYEKTFYVDMYYAKNNDITVNNANCNIIIEKPTPDDKTLDYAQSLDNEDTPVESDDFVLGKLFAQKVILSCK